MGWSTKRQTAGLDFSGIKHTPTKLNKGAAVMLQDRDYQMPQRQSIYSVDRRH